MTTVIELKKKCKREGISGYSSMNKSDLEKALKLKKMGSDKPDLIIPLGQDIEDLIYKYKLRMEIDDLKYNTVSKWNNILIRKAKIQAKNGIMPYGTYKQKILAVDKKKRNVVKNFVNDLSNIKDEELRNKIVTEVISSTSRIFFSNLKMHSKKLEKLNVKLPWYKF